MLDEVSELSAFFVIYTTVYTTVFFSMIFRTKLLFLTIYINDLRNEDNIEI